MKKSFTALLLLFFAFNAAGTEPWIRLWQGDAPLAKGKAECDIPVMKPYLPADGGTNRPAILILPGGGYRKLAVNHEGEQYAKFFNRHGIAAFVLRYRLGDPKHNSYRHPAMLMDAERAMRVIRLNAEKFGVDPRRVGVIGSSAGGHLAATLLTKFSSGRVEASDPAERFSSRPDFGILCYPVITLKYDVGYKGARTYLLGDKISDAGIRELSAEENVRSDTPICFIWHAWDDPVVPVENSIRFAQALRAKKVPFELHIVQYGRHGLGLRMRDRNRSNASFWPEQAIAWMRQNRILTAPSAAGTVPSGGANLTFRLVKQDVTSADIDAYRSGAKEVPMGYKLMSCTEIYGVTPVRRSYLVSEQIEMDGSNIREARAYRDQFGQCRISIRFDSAGTAKFFEVTKKYVGMQLAIVFDGKLYCAPRINEPIAGGGAEISGNFSIEEAKMIAAKIAPAGAK